MEKFLTSELFKYILIAFLVFVLAALAHFLLSSFLHHIRVARFFSQYRPSAGIVLRYEKIDEETDVTLFPAFTGKSMHFIPRIIYTLGQYYVLLECRYDGRRFRATYQISAEDYEQAQSGASVQIKRNWRPVGYELL